MAADAPPGSNALATETYNGSSLNEPATMVGTSLQAAVPCSETAYDASRGASCLISTTADAVAGGFGSGGGHATWELGQVQVLDGAQDGVAGRAMDNVLFLKHGIPGFGCQEFSFGHIGPVAQGNIVVKSG